MELIDPRIIAVVVSITSGIVYFFSVMMVILSLFFTITSVDDPLRIYMRNCFRIGNSPLAFAFSFYDKSLGWVIFLLTACSIGLGSIGVIVAYLGYGMMNLILYPRIFRQ